MKVIVVMIILLLIIQNISCLKQSSDSMRAIEHFKRMFKSTKCKEPSPRVVHVNEFMRNSKKKYIPGCTVLHFCDNFSGCCHQESDKCSPKSVSNITLYFLVIELTADGKQRKGVETIVMTNHTECHCRPINEDKQI